jgi:hypothetical protein
MQGSRVRLPGTTKNVVGLERGPLSLVSTTEELLDRKIAVPRYDKCLNSGGEYVEE